MGGDFFGSEPRLGFSDWIGRPDKLSSTSTTQRIRSSLSDNAVSAIREDGSGGLWIGTHGGGLNRFDRSFGTLLRVSAQSEGPSKPEQRPYNHALQWSPKACCGVGTEGGGLNRFDTVTGHFKIYHNDPRNPA